MKVTSNLPLTECPDCSDVHLGRCGGLSFVERLRTTQIHGDALPTKTKRKYWDQSALDDQFGDDAAERVLDQTEGRGFNNGPATPQDVAKMFE